MIAAIGSLSGASRQLAIYERYFAPKFRPASIPSIPELSAGARERLHFAALANSAMLRTQADILRAEAAR